MESYLCSPNNLVLLVGEGNFSFSRDFLDMNRTTGFPTSHLYSTCYESNVEEFSSVKVENIEALKAEGVNVLFGVDATQLSKDSRLNEIKFTKFIFNFPHTGGKMKINQNRDLLRQFCEECKQLIVGSDHDFTNLSSVKRNYYKHCEVIIPLCKGQGGTVFDEIRNWEDTWKIVEVAGESDLVLSNVEYFDTEALKHYFSIGFRSREQHFNTVRGIIHILKLSLHPQLNKYDTWLDKWSSWHVGQLMDMKQTLTESIFNGFKKEFEKAIEQYNHADSSLHLEFETNVTIREGLGSSKEEIEDPNKIYDLRVFKDASLTSNFQEYPLEYCYTSCNPHFQSLCLAFCKGMCDKMNNCDRVAGTRLPKADTLHENTDEQFTVLEQSGTIVIQNCVSKESLVVFETNTESSDKIDSVLDKEHKNQFPKSESCLENLSNFSNIESELKDDINVNGKRSTENYHLEDSKKRCEHVCFSKNGDRDSVLDKDSTNQKTQISNERNEISIHPKVTWYIFHLQKFAQFLSGSKDWRVIFSSENSISIDNQTLHFHFAQLSPVEYKFDLNFTVQSSDYSHDNFYKCLWFIVPEIIQDVQLINEHQNPMKEFKSYLFRFWYKSYDRPMYRKKVIEIHQNVIGKYLEQLLGVKVD